MSEIIYIKELDLKIVAQNKLKKRNPPKMFE